PKTSFDPLVVKVVDAAGRPVPNATVTWVTVSGTGTVSSPTTVTDASGNSSNTFASNFLGGFAVPFTQTVISATVGASAVQFTETQALNNAQTATTQPIGVSIPTGQQVAGPAGGLSGTTFPVTVASTLGIPVPGVAVTLGTDDPAGGPTVSC